MAENPTTRHAERIVSSITHNGTPQGARLPDTNIIRSWARCLESYGIDPAGDHHTQVIEHGHLLEHQDRLSSILDIAREEMHNLYQQISGSGFAIILTDEEGVIIDCVCDPTLTKHFSRAGLWLGAIWNEQNEGTNGIGTCIIEKQPLTIHRNEHFSVAISA